MTAQAWLDPDGYHVWFAHDCRGSREVDMLPWPTWRVEEGAVKPSIDCSVCGLHRIIPIGHALNGGNE